MSAAASPPHPSRLSLEFQQRLSGSWRQDTVCGRHYIKTDKLREWMTSVSPGHNATNLKRLLDEVWRSQARPVSTWQPTATSISTGEEHAVIVFSILLAIGHGYLVDIFREANITDHTLIYASEEHHYLPLAEQLRRKGVSEVEIIIDQFKMKKWSFCPVIIKRDLHGDYRGCGWVLPYCKRQLIYEGGTATVFQVLVQEKYLSPDLKDFLKSSLLEDDQFGWCYELALKCYQSKMRSVFDWEKLAFAGIRDQEGMVRIIGHYSLEEEPDTWTHNILLEFGELDLDQFFAHERSSPPVRPVEIVNFWESLSKVANALDRFHNLIINQDGKIREFHGWHADLKPDNILRVHGEFKLADFGFAKFKEKGAQAIPTEYLEGFTETYGAPEVDPSRSETRTPHGQTIDIWSFGCILSRAATWVILGPQGILQYDWVRREAIERLRRRGSKGVVQEGRSVGPTADDAYQDGKKVLPVVLQWHDYLRSIVRKSDTISSKILDLVDTKMLREQPKDRVSSKLLCEDLNDIALLATMKAKDDELSRRVEDSLLEALYRFDREAGNTRNPVPPPKSTKLSKVANRKGKSQLYDIPAARTAHRADMLHQELNGNTILKDAVFESPTNIALQLASLQVPGFEDHRRYSIEPEDIDPGVINFSFNPSRSHTGSGVARQGDNYQEGPRGGRFPREEQRRNSVLPKSPVTEVTDQRPPEQEDVSLDNRGDLSLGEKARGKMPAGEKSAETYRVYDGAIQEPVSQVSSTSHPDGKGDKESSSTKRDSKLEPVSSISLPWSYFATVPPAEILNVHDVCAVRKDLEKSRGIVSRKFKKDRYLEKFINDRDMKFIVDNGSSMRSFWDAATYVLETLTMKLSRLDDDGLDLVFTRGQQKEITEGGSGAAKAFGKCMQENKPSIPKTADHEVKTDMTETFGIVFENFLQSRKSKRLTILVLTDGLWRGTQSNRSVEEKIATFVKKARQRAQSMEDRRYTISFIRFGDYPDAIDRLTNLDNNFHKDYEIPDMIDHVPWTGPVYKMILGSFVGTED